MSERPRPIKHIGNLSDLNSCYVAKQGELTSHGDTVKEAINDLQFKIIGAEDINEVVGRVIANQSVSMAEYHAITGACSSGIRDFLRDSGIDFEQKDSMPLADVLTLTEGAHGGADFSRIISEVRQHGRI